MKHTPGPWKLKTEGTFDRCGVTAKVKLPASKEVGNLTIAECNYDHLIKAIGATQQDHHKRSNDVSFLKSLQEANARLIAAAPELLEALKDALKTAKFESHAARPWHGKAELLIARIEAKGGE